MKPRGFTLLELLVASAVGLLLLGLILGLFQIGRATFLKALDDTEQARASYQVPREILDRMTFSKSGCVSQSEDALAFLSAYDAQGRFCTDPQGRPEWQAYEVYFVPFGGHELQRKRVAFRGEAPTPLSGSTLQALRSSPGVLVCPGVDHLTLRPSVQGSYQLALHLRIQGYAHSYSGEVSLWGAAGH